jgi:glutathione synthase/RimK-type ligase-like ATP-grasp enzyme
MRIHIIADWINPTIATTLDLLSQRHVEVKCLFPDQQMLLLSEVKNNADLYVLKSGTELALGLAACLYMQGAHIVNPYPTVAMLRNKIIVTQALHAAGIPVPETYVTTQAEELRPLLARGPLLLKPYRGSRGVGIRLLRTISDLGEVPPETPIFVQQFLPPDGPDHKIFRIGKRFFGVRRIWPLRSYEDKIGVPFELDDKLLDLATRCGKTFDIDLYGIDVIYSKGRPYVVDVNKFGSFMGVPDAPRHLADYLYAAGERAMQKP